MKVTIKDREKLLEIRPDDLEKYLVKNEWEKYEEIDRNNTIIGSMWKNYSNTTHKHSYVRLITDVTIPDYASRMAENLMEIESNTNQSQLNIYADITNKPIMILPKDALDRIMEN